MGGAFGGGKGGGTGGGGGGSGTVAYPSYMEDQHEAWLGEVDSLIQTAVSGDNPFTTATAYDPDSTLDLMDDKVDALNTVVTNFDPETDWETLFDAVETKLDARLFDDDKVEAVINSHNDLLYGELQDEILPLFKAGLQNVNATMTSAFVIGEALLLSKYNEKLADFSAKIRYQNSLDRANAITKISDSLLKTAIQQLDYYKIVAHYGMEATRLRIVAKKEESEINVGLDEKDSRWDLEMYTYGGNMLAAIGGGTISPANGQLSTGQSAIGGALSGASTGMMLGQMTDLFAPGTGAIVGGILGGLGGLLG